jgi:hypothetical protein
MQYPIQRNWTISQLDNGDGTFSYVPANASAPNSGFCGSNPVPYLSPGYMGFRSAPDYGISASATCTGGALAGSVIVSPDGKSTTLV